ncbi:MAG: metallophosphoesterase [Nitrospiraceae bacterium]|nr:metallophosphoesterase [Nitrospiraceae bacterium]
MRILLRSLWVAAALILIASGIDSLSSNIFPHQGWPDWVLTASRVWLFASFLGLLAMVMVRITAKLAVYALPATRRNRFDQSRRNFLRYGVSLAGSSPFLAAAYGYSARLEYRIIRAQVPVAHLPEKLDGLKIAQLSDIHRGAFMQRDEVRRAVEMANQLHPDLIVVTGDFISWKNDPLEDCILELSRLRAPLGVWGCNGNHEIYAGTEHLSQVLFHRYGMRLLRQQNAELQWHGAKINLIGVDYQRQTTPKQQMLASLESLIQKDMPNILLSHNPNSFYRAAELGIELSLAGHTHGGQIQIAGDDLNPARLYTEFVEGAYHLALGGDAQKYKAVQPGPQTATLYVNRGLGTIWIPVRLGVPPEITLLTLRRAV